MIRRINLIKMVISFHSGRDADDNTDDRSDEGSSASHVFRIQE